MRRITFAALGTVSSLVMIFAYPTSHNASVTDTTTGSSTEAGTEAATTGSSTATSADDSAAAAGSTSDDDSGAASEESDDDGSAAATSSSSSTATATRTAATATASKTATSTAARTYTGDAVQTRWGIVQVQITVKNGKVTAAQAIQHPTGGRNDEINAYAVPILNSEAVAAQSARIDSVSGATVTSNGYTTSVQSALDAANL